MALPTYDKMLDKLYSNLPENLSKKERFEIPRAQSIRQGSRTILQNFNELVSTLERDPAHVLKFLNKELATVGNMEKHRVIFQGKFLSKHINDKIALYAKEFVFCPECGLPDTKLVKEDRVQMIKCLACGARKPVRNI